MILEANLTAATLLGVPRGSLVKQLITRFILKADQDIYYLLSKKIFQTGKPQACELQMLRQSGTSFWARLEASAAQEADDVPVCRIMMSDILERKQAEELLIKTGALQSAIFNSANFSSIATDAKGSFRSSMSVPNA